MDKEINVKFNGGREVKGTLKGYDALMNLVLDDVNEVVRDDEGNESTRSLGLVVVRGTLLVLVSPVDGSEEIANPFVQADSHSYIDREAGIPPWPGLITRRREMGLRDSMYDVHISRLNWGDPVKGLLAAACSFKMSMGNLQPITAKMSSHGVLQL
ncbi:hypothetical protein G7046_g9740 [Stylonectria norvegica]|nr:hypothetical protein G7046_g9740 [Stylonectria norvegica]